MASTLVPIILATAACVAAPGASGPLPPAGAATWPEEPELLPLQTVGGGDEMVTCGGRAFPAGALDSETGAERASGPEYDALRATIADMTSASAFPGSSTWTWRLAARDSTGATFLAQTDAFGPPGWVSADVSLDAAGWHVGGMGQCTLATVLSPEFGPATWALDPTAAPPGPETTELRILVWEWACSSGSPATGRMSAPTILFTAETVTITIGVRPLPGGGRCPVPAGTPAIVRLPEPLGQRSLLDGGHVPPAPPSPF